MSRRVRSVAIVLVLVMAGLGLWLAPAEAICAGPTVAVSPDQGPQGSSITITGDFYWDHCNDLVVCNVYTPTPSPSPGEPTPSPSPTSTCDEGEPPQPLQDIRLEFVQGDRIWDLGTVDADNQGKIRLETDVPGQAGFGDAKVRACPYDSGCTHPAAEFRVSGVLAADLARTGANVGGLITAGIVAIAVGLLVVGLARSSARAVR